MTQFSPSSGAYDLYSDEACQRQELPPVSRSGWRTVDRPRIEHEYTKSVKLIRGPFADGGAGFAWDSWFGRGTLMK